MLISSVIKACNKYAYQASLVLSSIRQVTLHGVRSRRQVTVEQTSCKMNKIHRRVFLKLTEIRKILLHFINRLIDNTILAEIMQKLTLSSDTGFFTSEQVLAWVRSAMLDSLKEFDAVR